MATKEKDKARRQVLEHEQAEVRWMVRNAQTDELKAAAAERVVELKAELEGGRRQLEQFLEKVAGLNAEAGEIGAGMLAQLVEEAKRLKGEEKAAA